MRILVGVHLQERVEDKVPQHAAEREHVVLGELGRVELGYERESTCDGPENCGNRQRARTSGLGGATAGRVGASLTYLHVADVHVLFVALLEDDLGEGGERAVREGKPRQFRRPGY